METDPMDKSLDALDRGVDYSTLKETAHITVALNKLMAQLEDSMGDLQKEVDQQALLCEGDMFDFQKRFDVVLNNYLGEGTEIRVKRHVIKLKEDIEAYNAKCCESIRLQATHCNDTCAKALSEMFDTIRTAVDNTLDDHGHRMRTELMWIRGKYEEKLEACRLSKAREIREKELADQAVLNEKREAYHKRSSTIILECLTKFREELYHLRQENEGLQNRLIVNNVTLRQAQDKVAELKTQLSVYELPFEERKSTPTTVQRSTSGTAMQHQGSAKEFPSFIGAGPSERLLKQLKGEMYRLKQKEEIAQLREKESHRTIQSLSDKLEKLQAQHETLQQAHEELVKAHQQGKGRRKSGAKRRVSRVTGALGVNSNALSRSDSQGEGMDGLPGSEDISLVSMASSEASLLGEEPRAGPVFVSGPSGSGLPERPVTSLLVRQPTPPQRQEGQSRPLILQQTQENDRSDTTGHPAVSHYVVEPTPQMRPPSSGGDNDTVSRWAGPTFESSAGELMMASIPQPISEGSISVTSSSASQASARSDVRRRSSAKRGSRSLPSSPERAAIHPSTAVAPSEANNTHPRPNTEKCNEVIISSSLDAGVSGQLSSLGSSLSPPMTSSLLASSSAYISPPSITDQPQPQQQVRHTRTQTQQTPTTSNNSDSRAPFSFTPPSDGVLVYSHHHDGPTTQAPQIAGDHPGSVHVLTGPQQRAISPSYLSPQPSRTISAVTSTAQSVPPGPLMTVSITAAPTPARSMGEFTGGYSIGGITALSQPTTAGHETTAGAAHPHSRDDVGINPQDFTRFLAEERKRHNERMAVVLLRLQEKDILLTNAVRMVQVYRHEYDSVARRLLETALDLQDQLLLGHHEGNQPQKKVIYKEVRGSQMLKLTPLYLPVTGTSVLVKAPMHNNSSSSNNNNNHLDQQAAAPYFHYQPIWSRTTSRQRARGHDRPSTCPASSSSASWSQRESQRVVRNHLQDELFAGPKSTTTAGSLSPDRKGPETRQSKRRAYILNPAVR